MKYIIAIYIFLFLFEIYFKNEVLSKELKIKDKVEIGYKINVKVVLTDKKNITFVDEYNVCQINDKLSLIIEAEYTIEVLEIDRNNFADSVKIIFNRLTKNVKGNACNYPLNLNIPYYVKKTSNGISVKMNEKQINDLLFKRIFLFPLSYELNCPEITYGKAKEEVLADPGKDFIINNLDFISGSTKLDFFKSNNDNLYESHRINKYKFKMNEKECIRNKFKSFDCEYETNSFKLLVIDSYIRSFKEDTKKVEQIIGYDNMLNVYGIKLIETFESDNYIFNK